MSRIDPSDSPASPRAPREVPAWPIVFQALTQARRPLLLQGPMGSFFSDLARLMNTLGQQATKVHFNGGDEVFWNHPGALRYAGGLEGLSDWLRALMVQRRIDAVVLFGQMRPIHVVARQVAKALGVQVFVFEEGYLRPDWVTIERRGVNALSRQPRLASFYRDTRPTRFAPPMPTGQNIWRQTIIAAVYGLAFWLLRPLYGTTPYHRPMNPWREAGCWLRGGLRRWWYAWRERRALKTLSSPTLSRRWFLVPLQVGDDSQVRDHSRFRSIEAFIDEVVQSFAQHAPPESLLVIKHHPMDRAYADYTSLINRLREVHGLGDRLCYVHDQHLPTLLHHAQGVVTINSTVGLQALYHGVPVKTLADSVYQIPGMVYDGSLEAFWNRPGTVDAALVTRFRAHLVACTQLNASFYARRPAFANPKARVTHAAEPAPSRAARAPLPELTPARQEPVVVQQRAAEAAATAG